ncbi:MAG TPA: DUF3616 domain-containing protein [Methylomirabilota bacterium]|nr:DUF3616 domain-containing protein [Methylomirabilota bacterium]
MRRLLGLFLTTLTLLGQGGGTVPQTFTHTGICDASAGAVIGTNLFVVGNDEENLLNIYRIGHDGPPVGALPVGPFLLGGKKKAEIDLEGAVRVGNRIYWISSHGRNKDAKEQPSRQRFFATDIDETTTPPTLRFVGKPYSTLLRDITIHPELRQFQIAAATRKAPKDKGGFNIEGLAAGPNGSMYIGLRNPVPNGKALLIQLLNPAEVISGRIAKLGEVKLLNMHGLGVRDMLMVGDKWFILGGPVGGGPPNRLYSWDGSADPKLIQDLQGFNAEAIFHVPGASSVWLVSDEGSRKMGKLECKDLKDPQLKSFRSMEIPNVF